jgi:hypothetical protein
MSLHKDEIELRADGMLLRFSSSLLSFLAKWGPGRTFHLGDWLKSLDEDTLAHLRQLTEQTLHDPRSIGIGVEDLLSLILHLLAAERQTETIEFNDEKIGEYIGLLGLLATLERLRRKGFLDYESFMSIELDAANTVILDKRALEYSEEIEAQLKRSLH